MKRMLFLTVFFLAGLVLIFALSRREQPLQAATDTGEIRKPAAAGVEPDPALNDARAEQRRNSGKDLADSVAWKNISRYLACGKEGGDCVVPESDTDPRAQLLDAGAAILDKIPELRREREQGELNDSALTEAVEALLAFPDERVKLEALRLSKFLPNDDAVLDLMLKQLEGAVDPELITEVLPALRRYLGTSEEGRVLDFVEKVLFSGSFYASREMAASAYLLIYEGNRSRFERWAAELPPGTIKQRLFQESLERSRGK